MTDDGLRRPLKAALEAKPLALKVSRFSVGCFETSFNDATVADVPSVRPSDHSIVSGDNGTKIVLFAQTSISSLFLFPFIIAIAVAVVFLVLLVVIVVIVVDIVVSKVSSVVGPVATVIGSVVAAVVAAVVATVADPDAA